MDQATPSAPTPPPSDLNTDWFDPLEDDDAGEREWKSELWPAYRRLSRAPNC